MTWRQSAAESVTGPVPISTRKPLRVRSRMKAMTSAGAASMCRDRRRVTNAFQLRVVGTSLASTMRPPSNLKVSGRFFFASSGVELLLLTMRGASVAAFK